MEQQSTVTAFPSSRSQESQNGSLGEMVWHRTWRHRKTEDVQRLFVPFCYVLVLALCLCLTSRKPKLGLEDRRELVRLKTVTNYLLHLGSEKIRDQEKNNASYTTRPAVA